jgi:hypothetical protein
VAGVSLGGATLAVTLGYAPPDGQQFTLIDQQGDEPVDGTFAGLADGATFQVEGTTFGITYVGGSGNDVVLVAGPPPSESCVGDRDGNGVVAVNELIIGVTIALGEATTDACPRFDTDANGQVAIAELVEAVGNALDGCPIVPSPAP